MKNILRVIKMATPLHVLGVIILLLAVCFGLLQQVVPILSREIVAEIESQIISGEGNTSVIFNLVVFMFAGAMASTLFNSLLQRSGDHFGGELRKFIIEKFYDHIFRLPQSYFDTEISGKILNQLNRGVFAIEEFVKFATNFIIPNILITVITIGLLFTVSWEVAVFIIVLFPIYTALSYYSSKKWGAKEVQKNQHEDNSRGRIQEVIPNMRLVKGFSNQTNEFNYVSNEQAEVNTIYGKQSTEFHVIDFVRNTTLNIVMFGVYLIIFNNAFNGIYTIAEVVFIIQLLFQIQIPLRIMSAILTQIQTTEAGTKEYFAILDMKEYEDYSIKSKLDLRKEKDISIEFNNVSFNYESSNTILNGINLRIEKGEKVALVGHSGAGKSTIINLICKFYDPKSGDILLAGKKYTELSHNDVRSNISLVFQENELFSTTIRENVAYGSNASNSQVIDALKKANAWGFVSKFKDGIDTPIGERGIRLSGGQKQRVQIARAIMANAPIVILDEATSNLDSKSEKSVQKALDKLMENKIVIIIAHRFSTIQNVDKIFVISKGDIVDNGSPKELANREGIYKDLLTYQLEGDKKLLKNFDLVG